MAINSSAETLCELDFQREYWFAEAQAAFKRGDGPSHEEARASHCLASNFQILVMRARMRKPDAKELAWAMNRAKELGLL